MEERNEFEMLRAFNIKQVEDEGDGLVLYSLNLNFLRGHLIE
jgi:hypothetical protein